MHLHGNEVATMATITTINSRIEFFEAAFTFLEGVLDLARQTMDAELARELFEDDHVTSIGSDGRICVTLSNAWAETTHVDGPPTLEHIVIGELIRLRDLLVAHHEEYGYSSEMIPAYVRVMGNLAQLRSVTA
jgi:hypothetical protein